MRTRTIKRPAFLLAAFCLVPSLSAVAEDVIKLKLSTFLPATHRSQTEVIEPWVKALEERTAGRVTVEIFPAGSAFGHVAKQMDQVRAGVVDIAHGLTGIPRGRLPRTTILDLPFLVQTADAASRALWALYPDYLKPEYKDLRVLALHAHNAGLIHTREKPVRTMEDMAGLRLRTPSVAIAMMLEQLGASPVGMPPTQVYENLQKGVLDGTVFAWDAVYVFKLYEVLGYHLDARAYTTSFFFVMNERRYRGLPDDVRAVVDELSGEPLVAQFAAGWDRWDEPGLKASKERGDPIISLSDEERARWREALEPVIDRYLSEVESKGVENAREIYTKAQEYVAQFENR